MSLCANSQLISSTFGSRSGYFCKILSTVKYWFVTTVSGIPSLSVFWSCLIFLFFIISLSLYVQRPNVDLSNHYKGFCKIRGRQRPPDTPSWAWFLGIETSSSSSNLKLTSEFHSVCICDNSLQNFFISDVGTGDPRVNGLQLQWCRWTSSKMMGLQSLRSELRAGHFLLCPAAKAGPDPVKTQVLE